MVSTSRQVPGGIPAAAQRLRTRSLSGEQHGPCPACGGDDRFWLKPHISEPGSLTFTCRRCDDPSVFAKALDEALGTFPRQIAPQAPVRPHRHPPRPLTLTQGEKTRRKAAQGRWRASSPLTGTPGEQYLLQRGLIRPGETPPSVRWLPAAKWVSGSPFMFLQPRASGAILFGLFPPGEGCYGDPKAVAFEQIGGANRNRQTVGPRRGLVFPALAREGEAHILCEGPADALALSALLIENRQVATVSAAFGTDFANIGSTLPRNGRVIILADNDPPGKAAARSEYHRLLAEGRTVSWAVFPGDAEDPADAISQELAFAGSFDDIDPSLVQQLIA